MSAAEAVERSPYRGYRFPFEIIAHSVWLYSRVHLSLREVQHLLAERGIIGSHETIRQSCTRFGVTFAAGLRRPRARAGDKAAASMSAASARANPACAGVCSDRASQREGRHLAR